VAPGIVTDPRNWGEGALKQTQTRTNREKGGGNGAFVGAGGRERKKEPKQEHTVAWFIFGQRRDKALRRYT